MRAVNISRFSNMFTLTTFSWYSWCVQSAVNGVYAFGFLFMLPQLFVNYKVTQCHSNSFIKWFHIEKKFILFLCETLVCCDSPDVRRVVRVFKFIIDITLLNISFYLVAEISCAFTMEGIHVQGTYICLQNSLSAHCISFSVGFLRLFHMLFLKRFSVANCTL